METQLYNNRKLTTAEILLIQHFERKDEIRKKIEDEKKAEKMLISQYLQSTALSMATLQKTVAVAAEKPPDPTKKDSMAQSDIDNLRGSEMIEESATASASTVLPGVPPSKPEKSSTSIPASVQPPVTAPSSTPSVTASSSSQPPAASSVAPPFKIRKREVEVDAEEPEVRLPALFSPQGLVLSESWNSEQSTAKVLELPNFSISGNQTIAITLSVPVHCKRWSFNICPHNHHDFFDILCHFNPRYGKKELILTDRQGTWGLNLKRAWPSGLDNPEVEIIIQITAEGFCVFINSSYQFTFLHRRDIKAFRDLCLVLPVADEMGVAESVVFKRVWWGEHHLHVPKSDITHTPKFFDFTNRSIYIQGLPLNISDAKELYEMEKACYQLFTDFEVEVVSLVPLTGSGYVRLKSPEDVLPAIDTLNGAEFEMESGLCTLSLSPMKW